MTHMKNLKDWTVPTDERGHDEQCVTGINQPCDCFKNPRVRASAQKALLKLAENRRSKKR